jgi:phosphoglycerol transferase
MTATHPENTEATTTRLGVLAGIGFVGLMLYVIAGLAGWKFPSDDGTVAACAALLFAAFIWCTVGGFGSIFNTFVSPVIRAYNRIIVYIVFFILAAYAGLATKWLVRVKTPSFAAGLLLVALTGLAYADVFWYGPQIPNYREMANSDHEFVASVEQALGGSGMIFQLPFTEFPWAPGPGRMTGIDPARGYLNSAGLRWSWGIVRGTTEARWMQSVAVLPPAQMLTELAGKGFRGLWIDTYGYADNPSAMPAGTFAALLGRQPIVSPDKRYEFFELGQHR